MRDHEHPFFRPLWRRIAVLAVCLIWAVVEFASNAPFWGIIALGFSAYAVWQFFFLFDADKNGSDTPSGTKE